MHEMPKKGKDMKLCEAYRDIALACEAGKVYHGILRTHLVPEYWSFCSQTQYGGVKHRGCDFGNLAGRSFMQIVKARGWSGAVVFFDAITASVSTMCPQIPCIVRDNHLLVNLISGSFIAHFQYLKKESEKFTSCTFDNFLRKRFIVSQNPLFSQDLR